MIALRFMVARQQRRHFVSTTVAVAAVVAGALAAGDLTAAEPRSPFAPAGTAEAAAPAAVSTPLDRFELSGVTRVGDVVQVCLVELPAQRGRWLTIGLIEDDLLAVEYDADRGAVLIRSGGAERWMVLRRGPVGVLPVVHKDDGSIDYQHMALSDREKSKKAAGQMWELMEISRLGRRDGAGGATGRSPPANAPPTNSPVR